MVTLRIVDIMRDKFNIYQMYLYAIYKKMKQSLYWNGKTRRFPRDRGSDISRQSAHDGGKTLSPRIGRLYPPFLVDSS